MTPRPWQPHRTALAVAALAGLAFVLLTVLVLNHLGPLQHVDTAVSGSAHQFAVAHPLWRSTMSAITRTGSTAVLGPAALVACLMLLGCRRLRQALFVATALLVAMGVRLLMVNAMARPRPVGWLAPAAGWSFPSGHSTATAAAAVIAVVVVRPLLRGRRNRLLLTVIAGAWAVAVGVSRVALSVHWPSDVLGAWLLVLAVVPVIAVGLGVLPDPTPADPVRRE